MGARVVLSICLSPSQAGRFLNGFLSLVSRSPWLVPFGLLVFYANQENRANQADSLFKRCLLHSTGVVNHSPFEKEQISTFNRLKKIGGRDEKCYFVSRYSRLSSSFSYAQDFWQRTNGPTIGYIKSLAANGAGHLFAAAGAGVFRSTDNGDHWTPINEGLMSSHIWSLAINAGGGECIEALGDGDRAGFHFENQELCDSSRSA